MKRLDFLKSLLGIPVAVASIVKLKADVPVLRDVNIIAHNKRYLITKRINGVSLQESVSFIRKSQIAELKGYTDGIQEKYHDINNGRS